MIHTPSAHQMCSEGVVLKRVVSETFQIIAKSLSVSPEALAKTVVVRAVRMVMTSWMMVLQGSLIFIGVKY